MVTEGIAVPPAGTDSARRRVAWQLAPLGIGLATLAMGALALVPFRSLSTNEAVAVARAREPLGDLLRAIVHHDPGQAGFLLILKGVTLAGTDERTMRAASVVALALAAALAVVLGTLLLDRVGGLVAGVALGANAGAVVAAREAAPYALGLLGIVAATLALVLALERRRASWWALYAVACVALPLAHPLAAAVLAAHAAAIVSHPEWRRSRLAAACAGAGAALAVLVVAWAAADRLEAPEGTDGLDLTAVSHGLLRATGWSPVLVAAALAGLYALVARRSTPEPAWKPALVAGLIAAPAVAVAISGTALPVFPDPALVACAPGLALAAGASCRLLPDRRLLGPALAALLAVGAVAIGVHVAAKPREDWRAVATAVRRVRGARESVVVLPARSRAAFSYYARYTRTSRYARGDGAWVAVAAGDPRSAIAEARTAVRTPRYALLRQFRYGDGLRLQHWVRP